MHSRIIELSKDPILKHERMCESSVPDWFYHSIADYTDADTDRDHDIKWFLDAVARVVDVAEDGKSFTFKPKAKQKYFERQYHAFLDKACELTGISLDAFVGEAKYDIGMAMYKLNEHYQDICWDLMKQLTVEEVEKGYQKCVAAFASNDPTGFGPLTKIVEDGIASWGSMIYLKGETLDEFKARKGATDMDQYMISSFAAIDRNGDWLGSGDMGWFGISTNDKEERAWNDELQTLMNEAQDDDFLVVVDCHI